MIRLNREQAIAVGGLFLLLLVCAFSAGLFLKFRADAVQELTQRREIFARLETRSRKRTGAGGQQFAATAPAAAFLTARTQGLAGAELLGYFSNLAVSRRAVLISSGVDLTREASPDVIRIQATMDVRLKALQTILFRLESGTPYVFVESLTVLPVGGAARGIAVQDPTLRVTLVLRALWRREAV